MNSIKNIEHSGELESSVHILAINKNLAILNQLAEIVDCNTVCLLMTQSRRQGLQILKEHPYIQAILLDVQLLTRHSQTFSDLVQQVTQPFYCPKIVCTGEHKDFDEVRTAMRYGASDYLCVPPNKDELMACIDRALNAVATDTTNFRYLQKIDQNFHQLQTLLLAINEHQAQTSAPQTEQHYDEVRDSEHPNPYMQKVITLTRLQEQKDQFEELPVLMSQAWAILMEIFKTEMSGRSAYVTTVALGSSVPASSTHRHLETLAEKNLIRRLRDASDKRRIQVQLTDKARIQLINFFDKI